MKPIKSIEFNPLKPINSKIVSVSYKIDGIQCIVDNKGRATTRGGHAISNVPKLPEGIYEIFCSSWNNTISALANSALIDKKFIYKLWPVVDGRLQLATPLIGLTVWEAKDKLEKLFNRALSLGYEGLMVETTNTLYKFKLKETFDVKVIGFTEGKGKYKGMIGALITNKGNVSSGLSDKDRALEFTTHWKNKVIEVDCQGLTKFGKFRHPRLIRVRSDK